MKNKLTLWFPPHIKPVRVGVYNASFVKDRRLLRYWDGRQWSQAWTKDCGEKHIQRIIKKLAHVNDIHWRGLSAAPTPEKP